MIAGYWLVIFCRLDASLAARRELWLLAVALLVLFGLFLAGPVSEHLDTVSSAYGDKPFVLPYLVVFAAYLARVQVDVAVMSARRWSVNWGARLRTVGAVVGALFCLHRALYTLSIMFGVQPPWPDYGATGVGNALLILAVVVQLAGIMAVRREYAA
jgi:hypothetical protein